MIDALARAGRLLIASDFDGTLAEIVDEPDLAVPLSRSKAALDGLAELDETTVAILSGRKRSELVERFDDRFVLIGEHGADRGEGAADPGPAMVRARELADSISAATPGSMVEHKTRSVAFHYRRVADYEPVVADLRLRASDIDGIRFVEGKMVVELTDSPVDKGMALETLARSLDVDRVLFMGDDVTDETAFAVLREQDVGIHVGTGPTRARATVPTPSALADFLEALHRARLGHFETRT